MPGVPEKSRLLINVNVNVNVSVSNNESQWCTKDLENSTLSDIGIGQLQATCDTCSDAHANTQGNPDA